MCSVEKTCITDIKHTKNLAEEILVEFKSYQTIIYNQDKRIALLEMQNKLIATIGTILFGALISYLVAVV